MFTFQVEYFEGKVCTKNTDLFRFCIYFTKLFLLRHKKMIMIISLEKDFIVYFCVSDNAYFNQIYEWFHLQTNFIGTFLGKLLKAFGGKALHIEINLTL